MGAGRFLLVLLLLGVQSSAIFERRAERSSHNCGDGEYLHQDCCCKYCPAGTYVHKHCECPHKEGKCYPCTAGKDYTAHANGLDECRLCKFCKEDEVIVSTCTLMSDTECQCKPGYFCPTPGCEMCHRCKSKCPEGKEIVQKCNATVDLECGHSPKGTANVAGWIAGVIVGFFFLFVAVCLPFLKKRIPYNKTDKENKDAEKYVESEDSTEILFAPEMKTNASILEIQNSVQSPPALAVNSPDSALRNELPEDTSVAFSERSGLLLHGENNLSEESYHRTAGYSAPVRDSEARPCIKVKELSQEALSDCFYYFIKEVPSRNWNMFMRTHLTDNEIEQTTCEHPKNIEEQYYQMLIIWRNKFGNEASIIKLLDSLWNIELRRSHENIVNHLISKDIITILEAKD